MYPLFFFKSFQPKAIKQLIELIDGIIKQTPDEEITLYIKSDGGFIDECYVLLDYLERSKVKLHVIGSGLVASTAVQFMLKVKALSKTCIPYAHIVLHLPDIETSLKTELPSQTQGPFIKKLYGIMVKEYLSYYKSLGLTEENCNLLSEGKDVFLTSAEFQAMLDNSMKTKSKKPRPSEEITV